jgi:hypothetical protein
MLHPHGVHATCAKMTGEQREHVFMAKAVSSFSGDLVYAFLENLQYRAICYEFSLAIG